MSADPHSDAAEARAARRYWTLQFVRLAGIFTTFLGAMIVAGRLAAEPVLGTILFLGGPVLFFAVPILLAKRWKREER